ncbi:MAG: hypothetical protein K2M34_04540 [Alphaproteobacteria bacterium]|nr:hypothetical protein [Alphaproteobacteria bacterium]
MDVTTIVQLLTNAGFNVKGVNATQTHLLIEDPSCIMRNFETFLEYAWVIVSLIAVILLFGWAISKIRGAKTDIATNIRNLLIMFGVLSATGPIVNLIYGDDLMARTCHIIQIPINDVQKILDARNSQLSQHDNLFESIEIFDSGMRSSDDTPSELNPVQVPEFNFNIDPQTGEPSIIDQPTPNNQTTEHISNDPDQIDYISNPVVTEPHITTTFNSNAPISARTISTSVIEYSRPDGTIYRHNNGTPAWRHTNPGNIVNSRFATEHGAIGRGRKFAIFPSKDVGAQAIVSLLRSPSYNNLSIINAIKRYAPAADRNDPVAYANTISRRTGLDVNRILNTLNDTEIRKVADIIQQVEGWTPGTVTY